MPITTDRSAAHDRPAILGLMDEARGLDLSDDERAQAGFVQGAMDESLLARLQSGPGVFVARDGSALAGFCITSTLEMVASGPPAEMIKALLQAMPELPLDQLFLYGPVAVSRRHQGQGVLTRLLFRVSTELRSRFALGALFVEHANQKSLAVHRHYPMTESAAFMFKDRAYIVFTFSPGDVVDHYRRRGV